MLKNTVMAGDYREGFVRMDIKVTKANKIYIIKPRGFFAGLGVLFLALCTVGISLFFTSRNRKVPINKSTVDSYELIGEETQTSATSAVARGAIGAALLGPVGIAAALSAKQKGLHTVAIQFKDGKRSLIQIDGDIYKSLVENLF